MRAAPGATGAKPDQSTPYGMRAYERLGWAGLGLVGGGSRTRALGLPSRHRGSRPRAPARSTVATSPPPWRGSVRPIATRIRGLSRVGPDVPEVHVERDEDAPFLPHHLTEARVVDTSETPACRRGCLVARIQERCGDVFGEVVVNPPRAPQDQRPVDESYRSVGVDPTRECSEWQRVEHVGEPEARVSLFAIGGRAPTVKGRPAGCSG
jgi:hypothetical protein